MKLQKLQIGTLLLLSICLPSKTCQANDLGGYNFDGNLNSYSNVPNVTYSNWGVGPFDYNGNGQRDNGDDFQFVAGVGSSPDQGLQSGPWTANKVVTVGESITSASTSVPKYWQFSIKPQNSAILNLDNITFQVRPNGQGAVPNTFGVAASTTADGTYTVLQLGSYTHNSGYKPLTINTSGSQYDNVSNEVFFRLFAFDEKNTNGGKIDIDQFKVQGTVVSQGVPFKFSPSLGIVSLGIIFGSRKLFKSIWQMKLATTQTQIANAG